jgi:hypothetical protein
VGALFEEEFDGTFVAVKGGDDERGAVIGGGFKVGAFFEEELDG